MSFRHIHSHNEVRISLKLDITETFLIIIIA